MAKRKKAAAKRAARSTTIRIEASARSKAGRPQTPPTSARIEDHALRLLLRRRQGRRQPDDEGHTRRQGLRPRRDDQRRPAGAAGFTISTQACNLYYSNGGKLTPAIEAEIVAHVKKLEKSAKAQLGSKTNPLLVSVRSGAKFSMPGMMDTILNLGLNDQAVEGLKARTGERPLRLRQLPPVHPDVRLGGPGDPQGHVRARVRGGQGRRRRQGRHRPRRSRRCARSSSASRAWSRPRRGSRSRRIRTTSCAWPATPSSARGTTRAPRNTGASTTSPTASAPPSTCR